MGAESDGGRAEAYKALRELEDPRSVSAGSPITSELRCVRTPGTPASSLETKRA